MAALRAVLSSMRCKTTTVVLCADENSNIEVKLKFSFCEKVEFWFYRRCGQPRAEHTVSTSPAWRVTRGAYSLSAFSYSVTLYAMETCQHTGV